MKVVKYGLVLLIVGVVAGGILAYSNSLTAPIIAEQEKAGSFAAFQEIFTDTNDFVAIDEGLLSEIIGNHATVQEVFEVKEGDEIVAYAFNTVSGGYGGGITTISGFNLDGTIQGIRIIDNSETPGLGTKIVDDPAYQESYVGKSVSEDLNLSASPASESEVLLLSGATVSAEGVLNGVNDAREAFVNFFMN